MILIKIILTILAVMIFLGFISFPFIDNVDWEDSGIIGKFFTVCFIVTFIAFAGFMAFIIGLVAYAVFTSIWKW